MLDRTKLQRPGSNPRPGKLMPAPIPRFEPGDLITAEMLNQFVDVLTALEARIAALEARKP